ncbi:MAG: protein kinase [Planctomycetota bacterium]
MAKPHGDTTEPPAAQPIEPTIQSSRQMPTTGSSGGSDALPSDPTMDLGGAGATMPARNRERVISSRRQRNAPVRPSGRQVTSGATFTNSPSEPLVARVLGIDRDVGVPAPRRIPLQPGSTTLPASAGRYEIRRELARGGMGAILLAFDRDVRRDVALKVLLDANPSRTAIARFLEEGQVTGQLEHPNIVPVHDVGLDGNGRLYFSMKVVRGQSLNLRLRELASQVRQHGSAGLRAFPLQQRLDILRKVCDAIAFAHSRGVIHRDLKPDNVMVGEFGEVQVMDWGIARVRALDADVAAQPGTDPAVVASSRRDAGIAPTMAGAIAGTPAYMSPEQAAGHTADVDERSDVYALGGILYEMLTLTSPGRGETLAVLLELVRAGEIDAPSVRVRSEFGKHAPHVPPELESICRRAMAVRKRDRYADVNALRADLDAYLDQRTVSAHRDPAWSRLAKWCRRNPARALSAGFSLVFALVVGLVVSVAIGETDRRARAEAQRALAEQQQAAEADARELAELRLAAKEGQLERMEAILGFRIQRELADMADEFERLWNAAEQQGQTPAQWMKSMGRAKVQEYIRQLEETIRRGEQTTPPRVRGRDWFYLGALHSMGLDDRETGLRCYQKAIELEPMHASARQNIASYYIGQGRIDEAREMLDRLLKDFPQLFEARVNRGELRRLAGDHEGALQDLEEAIRIAPTNASGYSARATLWLVMQKPDRALDDLALALELNPHDPLTRCVRARYYLSIGRLDAARDDLTAAEKDAPDDRLVCYGLGDLARRERRFADGVVAFTRALRADPQYVLALRDRGRCYGEMNQLEPAIADLRRAHELAPTEWAIVYYLGQALSAAGRRDEAAAAFVTAWRNCADADWRARLAALIEQNGGRVPD